jgi:Zn-finger nucleic acid-binding protein
MSDADDAGFSSTCPACKEEKVEELEDRGIPFLGCTACFGLFATEDDLAAYVVDSSGSQEVGEAFDKLLEAALAEGPPRQGKRPCPRCQNPLGRLGFGESPFVILDRCAVHGVWLDKKELKKVIRSSRAHAAVLGLIPQFQDDDDDDDD